MESLGIHEVEGSPSPTKRFALPETAGRDAGSTTSRVGPASVPVAK